MKPTFFIERLPVLFPLIVMIVIHRILFLHVNFVWVQLLQFYVL